MNAIEWSDRYATGVPRIDREHRELFHCVGRYEEACRDGEGPDRVDQALRFLLHYAMTHFRGEEAQMESAGYPGLEAHRTQHEDLLARVREMARDRHTGGGPASRDLARFAADWIRRHILESDMAFAAWLKDREGARG